MCEAVRIDTNRLVGVYKTLETDVIKLDPLFCGIPIVPKVGQIVAMCIGGKYYKVVVESGEFWSRGQISNSWTIRLLKRGNKRSQPMNVSMSAFYACDV
jgi:hypothetical protein